MLARSAAMAALAALAAAAEARAQQGGLRSGLTAGSPDAPVDIEADHITYDWESQVLKLDGHVVARREGGVVRASAGTLDRGNGLLMLTGGVLGVQGKEVFMSDSAVVDLDAHKAELRGPGQSKIPGGLSVLYLKQRPADPNNPLAGPNALILRGERVEQMANGRYVAQEVRLTPCDCAGEPDYELLAHTAELDEDRAHLHGTRLDLFGLTLPIFPLSLPLTQRQWGLLAPIWGLNPTYGFTYAQPVFIPLGDSYDVTLTPGYYTGGPNKFHSPALPFYDNNELHARTVRGPRLGVDLRYFPVQGTAGALTLDLFDDFDQLDSQGNPSDPSVAKGRGLHGLRGVAHLTHRTEAGAGVFAVQGTLASDVMALWDTQPYSPDRVLDALRTDVGAWRTAGPLTLGADATFLQDVRIDTPGTPDRRLYGPENRPTPQRAPGLFAQLAPVPVGGALMSLEASAVQFEPFKPPLQRERATGYGPTDENAGAAQDLQAGDLSRAPALRLDLSPRASWNLLRGTPVDLSAELGGRADAWLVEGRDDRNVMRAYGLAGARAGFPLERAYGDALHRIEPTIALRGLTRPVTAGGPLIGDPADAGGPTYGASASAAQQGVPPGFGLRSGTGTAIGVPAVRRPYDEIDGAAPSTGAVEAIFAVSQSLWRKGRGRVATLDLQQDALLWTATAHGRAGETAVNAGAVLGPVNVEAGARYDWADRAFSYLRGAIYGRDPRGDDLRLETLLLRPSSSERLRAGIDELFSAIRLATPAGDLAGNVHFVAGIPLPHNFRLAYDVSHLLTAQPLQSGIPDTYHSLSLAIETACHCAAVGLSASAGTRGGKLLGKPHFSFGLDLKQLGSFSTF